ncbi:MAG: hypothetical protein GF344_15290 [Chitinivibrionales bacterium]|nr:hypothetical protein [Chitinivibrionales bacterium]MBD3358069.1 hypothetical protein [Chitinivibrionales bacterium]
MVLRRPKLSVLASLCLISGLALNGCMNPSETESNPGITTTIANPAPTAEELEESSMHLEASEVNTPVEAVTEDSACVETLEDHKCDCIPEEDSLKVANDEKHYKVVRPNGGEVIAVGTIDTIELCLFAEDEDAEFYFENMELYISVDAGRNWMMVHGYTAELGSSAHKKRILLPSTIGGVTLDSDSCLFKIQIYDQAGDPNVDFDISDGYFTIQPDVNSVKPRRYFEQ